MKNKTNDSLEIEVADSVVDEFLKDINVALGYDYHPPGKRLFPFFSPQYYALVESDLLLYEELASAYNNLEKERQPLALALVRKALLNSALSSYLGLRRSLCCIDLAHEIDPDFGSNEEIHSALLLRPQEIEELGEWLWQLVRRWRKWNIAVKSSPRHWELVITNVAPRGILEVMLYFHFFNADNNRECWAMLRQIARERITNEKKALLNIGIDPDVLKQRLYDLRLAVPVEKSAQSNLVLNRSIIRDYLFRNRSDTPPRYPHPSPPPEMGRG